MSKLLETLTLGSLKLKNRVIMAPLTRSRAPGRIPNDLMRQYYVQRADAGMILTEATAVTAQGVGYADTPGIWSPQQVEGWRSITAAVHQAGGVIVLQLWHVGRVSDPYFLEGELPVAPSAVAVEGPVRLLRPQRPYVTPRALQVDEIPGIVEAYRQGARNALEAGFDGVEVHGANGYLLDQFLQDKVNLRTDEYGGCVENRARLMLEVVDAATSVWGADRVGLHLAPRCDSHSMGDFDPAATFGYVAREAGKRKLAFLCVRESLESPRLGPDLKRLFGGGYIANEGFTRASAEQILAAGEADAVAFGKSFLANPDLVQRIALDAPLNPPRPDSFYSGGAEGYIDYPALELHRG